MLWLTATFICAVSMLPLRVGSLHVPMTWNSWPASFFMRKDLDWKRIAGTAESWICGGAVTAEKMHFVEFS